MTRNSDLYMDDEPLPPPPPPLDDYSKHRGRRQRGTTYPSKTKVNSHHRSSRARRASVPHPPEDYYDSEHSPFEPDGRPPEDLPKADIDNVSEPRRFESERLRKESERRPPINGGTILALIGTGLLIIGILLPLYHMSFSADIRTATPALDYQGHVTGNESLINYSTDGVKTLLLVDGKSGIQVNIPTEDGDVESKFESTFPYGYLYVFILILGIILGLLAKSATKRGRRFIVSGFLALIPIFIIIILVSQLGTIIGEDRLEPPLDSFIDMLSAGPLGGALPLEIEYDYDAEVVPPGSTANDKVKVTSNAKFYTSMIWGLDKGGFLIILGSIITIAGGAVDIYLSRIYLMRMSAYREAVYRTYEDQHLSPDEANIIIGLRRNLDITEKEHLKIKSDVLDKLEEERKG